MYVDGRLQEIKVLLDELNQSFATNEPLLIGGGGRRAAFTARSTTCGFIATNLSADEVVLLATRDTIDAIVADRPPSAHPAAVAKLRHYYLERARAEADSRGTAESLASCANEEPSSRRASRPRWSWRSCPRRARHSCLLAGNTTSRAKRSIAGGAGQLAPTALGRRARSACAGPLAGRSGQSADGPGDRESVLAVVFRRRAGQDGRRFRRARRSAQPSGTCSIGWPPNSSPAAGT